MNFILSCLAYVTAAATGLKMLAVAANTIAVTAAANLQLPPQPLAQPSLVERRLIAQSAADAVVPKPTRGPVMALDAPEMPVAMLAVVLDQAETAYVHQPVTEPVMQIVHAQTQRVWFAKPQAASRSKLAKAKFNPQKPATFAALFDDASLLPPLKPAKAKGKKGTYAKSKQDADEGLFKEPRQKNSGRFAGVETPGALMFKGLLNRS